MTGADDYGRVYLNNYVVANKEATSVRFRKLENIDGPDLESIVVDRKANKLGADIEAREYLRQGQNVIIIELENAVGPCEERVDIRVNGSQLEQVPAQLPQNFQVDTEAVNAEVFHKFKVAESHGKSVPDPLDDVLCARRAYMFSLD
jgi:hypothetical protein